MACAAPRTVTGAMERSTLVRTGDLARELLGEDSDRNRKVVRRLVDRGILKAVRTAPDGNRGDWLIGRATVDSVDHLRAG